VFADELLRPWYDALAGHLPPGGVFDCHTHLGEHDPSGFAATTEELDEGLSAIGARAAVFPLKEPEGYGDANLRVAQIAARSSGRLVSLARLDPEDAPLHRAQEALDAGAVGFKLHPDGDELDLTDPRLDDVYALAAERRRPIVVHAGPEVSGVGRRTLSLLDRHDGLRIILAHCALGDLAWLWREVEDHPGLFFHTAWWGPVHVLALFSLVPPGRILLGSDVPFSSPQSGVLTTVRCALQAGLSREQLALVLGGQFERLVRGEEAADAGPPPGVDATVGPVLERVHVSLLASVESMRQGEDAASTLEVARHACGVAPGDEDAPVLASVLRLLELYDQHADRLPRQSPYSPGWDLVNAGAVVARTPRAPLPCVPLAQAATTRSSDSD
jgi:predicted TIM-barrel fold metal-dependent hydrolase